MDEREYVLSRKGTTIHAPTIDEHGRRSLYLILRCHRHVPPDLWSGRILIRAVAYSVSVKSAHGRKNHIQLLLRIVGRELLLMLE